MAIRSNSTKGRALQLHRTFVSARKKAEKQQQKMLREASFNLATIQNEISFLLSADEPQKSILDKLTDLACQVSNASWCGILQFDQGKMELVAQHKSDVEQDLLENPTLRSVCQLAAESQSAEANRSDSMSIVAAPVIEQGEQHIYKCVCLTFDNRIENVDTCELFAQLIATALGRLSEKKSDDSNATRQSVDRQLAKLVETITSSDKPAKAAENLAKGLCLALTAESVTIGLCDKRSKIKLVCAFDKNKTNVTAAEKGRYQAAMNDALKNDRSLVYPNSNALTSEQTHGTKRLHADYQDSTIINMPLRTKSGQIMGVATCVVADTDNDLLQEKIQFLNSVSSCLADCIECNQRAAKTALQRVWSGIKNAIGSRTSLVMFIIYMAAAGIMAIPVPHRIECAAVLEPTAKRYLVSPEQGIIRDVLVKPGQVVRSQQLVAQMEDSHLIAQRDELMFHRNMLLEQIQSNHGDAENPTILDLEIQKLEEKIARLSQKIFDCRIYSPIDGIVIEGDYHDSTNVPVQLGESLLVVAPMDELIVRLDVPQQHYQYVGTAQDVSITLESQGNKPLTGKIESLQPNVKRVNGKNMFVANVHVENPGPLRPGMTGVAHIKEQNRAIGWILVRRGWKTLTQAFN